jgi:hypothetical protein
VDAASGSKGEKGARTALRRPSQFSLITALASVVLCSACRSPGRLSEPCLDLKCVESAVVGLYLRDATQPVCLGTLVRSANGDDRVLTAAHCLDGGEALKVSLLSGARPNTAALTVRAFRHPRYLQGVPESPYDVALLSLDTARVPGARPIAVAATALQPGTLGWLPEKLTGGLRQVLIQRSDIRPLRVRLDDATGIWCRGDSGAPLLAFGASGLAVVAVMSGGEAACNGSAHAARLTSDVIEFLDRPRSEQTAWVSGTQTCAQCLDQNSMGTGPCVSAAQRCSATSSCAVEEQRLFETANHALGEASVSSLYTNEAGQPLWRCICLAACAVPCKDSCAQVH